MQFLLQYYIDLEKCSEPLMAIAVEGVEKTKTLTGCQEQDGGVPSEHLNVAALFVIMPTHP